MAITKYGIRREIGRHLIQIAAIFNRSNDFVDTTLKKQQNYNCVTQPKHLSLMKSSKTSLTQVTQTMLRRATATLIRNIKTNYYVNVNAIKTHNTSSSFRYITNHFMHHRSLLSATFAKSHANIAMTQHFGPSSSNKNQTTFYPKPHLIHKHAAPLLIAAIISLTSFTYSSYSMSHLVEAETVKQQRDPHPEWQAGDHLMTIEQNKLPTFTRKEVMQHNTEKSLWLTYRHGVFGFVFVCLCKFMYVYICFVHCHCAVHCAWYAQNHETMHKLRRLRPDTILPGTSWSDRATLISL